MQAAPDLAVLHRWQLAPVGSTCGADTVLADIRQGSNA
ncbi:hypothetical protein SAMN05216270_107184 [Glycomyces harbinensis]|uniref:Uncharacterized protein n=1 Tax=Glycomyces harbinensis TaxID=58114 RepID=A0A1G6XHS8_9ACTN|nr:hypothetical protein SAMN05216270_107184 [Glycomyces harbinensis]